MNWLLFILRVLFGGSTDGDPSDAPRVAIRPDGSTVQLPSESALRRRSRGPWDWLLPHWWERATFWSAHSLLDELDPGRDRDPGCRRARRQSLWDEFRSR